MPQLCASAWAAELSGALKRACVAGITSGALDGDIMYDIIIYIALALLLALPSWHLVAW